MWDYHTCITHVLQETKIEFINNFADSGGSAIFATDLGRCDWLGDVESDPSLFIFNPRNTTNSPFTLMYVACTFTVCL